MYTDRDFVLFVRRPGAFADVRPRPARPRGTSRRSLGEYYKRHHFLASNFNKTNTLVEYGAVTDYRLTFVYPKIYSFEFREETTEYFYTYQPRDLAIPGLAISFERLDVVAENILRHQLEFLSRALGLDLESSS